MKQKSSLLITILNVFVLLMLVSFPLYKTIFAQSTRQLTRDQKPAQNEKRIALVIGNSSYPSAPLRNPANDAADIASVLRGMGFEVNLQTNLDQIAMKKVIRAFGESLRAYGGVGLFYYAGHGVQSKGINYLIPVGATVNSEEEVEYEGVDAGLLLAQMESAKNRMNIVILDACRNNPFARSMRSADKGLASIDAPSGTLLAYSTAPGSVASDGTGRNGLYTQELLKQLKTSDLSIEDIFKRVRVSVRDATQNKQTPWESSSLTGDFYFLGNGKVSSKLSSTDSNSPIIKKVPSAEDVLASYSKTIGFTNFDAINTLVQKGTMETEYKGQKDTRDVEFYTKKSEKSAFILKNGKTVLAKDVYANGEGWIFDPKTGTKRATDLQIEFNKRNNAVTSGDLNLVKQFYPKITVRGIQQIDNREVYVLDATKSDGKTEVIYIDTSSNLLYRWDFAYSSVSTQSGMSYLVELYAEDYIDVNGFKIPLTIRQVNPSGTSTIKIDMTKIQFNVPLDDKLFTKP